MDPNRRMQYLDALGIPIYVRRHLPSLEPVSAPTHETPIPPPEAEPPLLTPPIARLPALGWDELQQRVSQCTACRELVANRTQTVFGVGNRQADWLIVGEAPGVDEDRQGEPFVGRAGQLLNAMLAAIGHRRDTVYIANILKCRPPGNRDPLADESAHCEPFLLRQIELIQPKILLSVGRISAQNLLQTDTPVGHLRGRVHHYGEHQIPLIVTYHPAYLLRSPDQKAKAWEDLQLAVKTYRDLGLAGST